MQRAVLSCVLLALGVGLVSACAKKPAEPDVAIGVVAELSGDIPAVGASCKQAAEMAVEEINAAGGIEVAGKRHGLKLVFGDTGGKPEQAVAAAKKLIDGDKVLALIGPNASNNAVPVAEVAEAAKILMISPWSTNPRTTVDASGAPRKFVFRACFTDAFEGHLLARFAQGYLHSTKAAVLYDADSEAPRSQAELFKKDFEEDGGKVVAFETFKAGDKDFAAQLKKIKEAGPEVVFLPSYYNDVPAQLKQARELGLTVPFLGSDNWGTPEFIKLSGKDAEGASFCTHYNAKAKSTVTGTFVVSYQNRYAKATPDDVAALTYDAFQLLAKAIGGAASLDRTAVRDAMAKITTHEGVTGKMTWKPGSGDPVKGAVMQKVENGEFKFITNIDP